MYRTKSYMMQDLCTICHRKVWSDMKVSNMMSELHQHYFPVFVHLYAGEHLISHAVML